MWTPRWWHLIQEKPRDGDAPEIDAFEAMKVVEQLSLAEVDDVIPEGDSSQGHSSRPGRDHGPLEDALGQGCV